MRHGTTNLFAAPNIATGEVVGDCNPAALPTTPHHRRSRQKPLLEYYETRMGMSRATQVIRLHRAGAALRVWA